MSHRDTVTRRRPASTCWAVPRPAPIAAIADRRSADSTACSSIPKWSTRSDGRRILSNFLFDICRLPARLGPARASRPDRRRHPRGGRRPERLLLRQRRRRFHRRLHALPARAGPGPGARLLRRHRPDARGRDRVRPADFSNRSAAASFAVEDAEPRFLAALAGVAEPDRSAISSARSSSKSRSTSSSPGTTWTPNWILGQGTIYPDTIESGGTAKADLIKTHHNRVAGIQKLIDEGRIVEPLHLLLQGRSPRGRARAWPAGRTPATAIRSPAPAWPSAACVRKRRVFASRTASRRHPCPGAVGWRARRLAQLSPGPHH